MVKKGGAEPMSKKYSLELIDYAHEVKGAKTATDAEVMDALQKDFLAMCQEKGVPEAEAKEFWQSFAEELKKRPHLAKFTQDAEGAKSMFFPRWVMDVIGQRMSRTMYPAYYKGYDVRDELHEITEDDPFYVWSDKDPVFVYVRGRDKLANEAMQAEGVKKILNPGAGNCPEIFDLDYDQKLLKEQQIHCCDLAKTGVKEKVAELDLPNFEYSYKDMNEFIQQELSFQPDLIVMKGTLSYRMDALPQVLGIADKILAPGGKIFFDLQLSHWAFLRNLETFTWGEGTFGLMESPEAAVELVRKVVTEGKMGFDVSGDDWYTVFDDAEGVPVGVAFLLAKK